MSRTTAAILGAMFGGLVSSAPIQALIDGSGHGHPSEVVGGALGGALLGAGLRALLAKRRRA